MSKIHFLNTFYAQLIILPKESRNQWQTERTRGDSRGNFVITDLSMTNSNSDIQLVANIQYTSIMQIEKHDTAQIIWVRILPSRHGYYLQVITYLDNYCKTSETIYTTTLGATRANNIPHECRVAFFPSSSLLLESSPEKI